MIEAPVQILAFRPDLCRRAPIISSFPGMYQNDEVGALFWSGRSDIQRTAWLGVISSRKKTAS